MWLPFSLVYAFFDGVQNAYYKKAALQISPVLMIWSILVLSGLLFSPLLLRGVPTLDNYFWIAVFARLILDSAAFTLFVTGVQKSPLSLTVPMTSLSPAFAVITGYFINNALPTPLGMGGVLLTVIGLYFLNFDHQTRDILSPFKAIFREQGVLFVTVSAILWSVVSSLQKLAIDHSDPYFYTAFFQIFWAVCFTPVVMYFDRPGFKSFFTVTMAKQLLPVGGVDAIKTLAQNMAYITAIPAYVNSIGSTSILFSTLFGWLFFKEEVKAKLIPLLVIITGIVCISFAH